MYGRIVSVLATSLLCACVAYKAPRAYPSPEPLIVEIESSSIWYAAIDVATEFQLPLVALYRESGYMSTQRILMTEPKVGAWWDCGSDDEGGRQPDWYSPFDTSRINLTPAPVSGFVAIAIVPNGEGGRQSQIRVVVSGLNYEGGKEWVRCASKGSFETMLAQKIGQRARELREATRSAAPQRQ